MERIETGCVPHAFAIDEAGDTVCVAKTNSNFYRLRFIEK
jgi:hypothetical protein